MRVLSISLLGIALIGGLPLLAAVPTLVSASPASGSGLKQVFTLTVGDTDGYQDLDGLNLLIAPTFDGRNACWIYVSANGGISLASDDIRSWGFNASTYAWNSQCRVFHSASVRTGSGNTLTVTLSIEFSYSFFGPKTIWARALDLSGNDTGYQSLGAFTVSGPPPDFTVSTIPSSASMAPGGVATFNLWITGSNGLYGPVALSASTPPAGVTITFSSPTISIPLNDTAGGFLRVTTATSIPTGSIPITVTFSAQGVTHTKQVTVTVVGSATPTSSVSPASGTGKGQTFSITVVNQNGYQAIRDINILISSSFSGVNACWFLFQPLPQTSGGGYLYLASDDTARWTQSVTDGRSDTLPIPVRNSQCTLFGGPAKVTVTPTSVSLDLPLLFASSFVGPKTIYLRAVDRNGSDSGYAAAGTWTVAPGADTPDFLMSLTPNTTSVLAGAYSLFSVAAVGANGFADTITWNITGLPPNVTYRSDYPPRPLTPGSRGADSATILLDYPLSTPPGTYNLTLTGVGGGLTRSYPATLTIATPAAPQISLTPSSGSAATQTFTFSITNPSGGNITSLTALFNATFDGRNACWIVYDTSSLWLASDDTATWTPSWRGAQNSQCSISLPERSGSGNTTTVTFTVAFRPAFQGAKNIYVRATNTQKGDSGYQAIGTWTVP